MPDLFHLFAEDSLKVFAKDHFFFQQDAGQFFKLILVRFKDFYCSPVSFINQF